MKKVVVFVLLVIASVPSHADWRERRAALSEMFQSDEFRIFYSRTGADALPNQEDANRNGTPDYVDRLAREFVAARNRYDRELQLTHPIKSPRYKNQAEFIDVNVLSFPLSTNGPRHGIAYDELSSFSRSRDLGRKVRVLVIDVANDLSPKNLTPAHELFHLYQNGYTFFKNRWYTEGTARWAESPSKNNSFADREWPRSVSEVRGLFKKTYDASSFWTSLASKADPTANGRAFIKALLEELDRMDDIVSATNGRNQWKEADQFSGTNDVYIWDALLNTLKRPEFLHDRDQDIESLMELKL